jgi:cell division protein YceG involved in septum cleavage
MKTPNNYSTEYMVRAVTNTLKNDVLPTLEQASWPAGNVRACLQLLTYIEDRVTQEGKAMFESNAAMRKLLTEIATGRDLPQDAELSKIVGQVLKDVPDRATYIDVADLVHENQRYQDAVATLIKLSHNRRDKFDVKHYDNLRTKLSACAAAAAVPENIFVERAQGMVPI